jgi:hypothetical protein
MIPTLVHLLVWAAQPMMLAYAPADDDPLVCAGAARRFQDERGKLSAAQMRDLAARLERPCPQLSARIRSLIRPSVAPRPAPEPVVPTYTPAVQSCQPKVIGRPEFTLSALASGGFQLTAPPGQCPAAGIGDSLVVDIELCGGRPSPFAVLRPAFQGYDRNGSRVRSNVQLGVATAGADKRYGIETLSGRADPRFATGAAFARLTLHGHGGLRDVAPELCAIQIR